LEDLNQVNLLQDLPKEEDKVHRGVKGASPLFFLNHFIMTESFVVDYMHCILLGVTKHHMEILFETQHRKKWERIGNQRMGKKHILSLIDARIKKMQSNSAIMRELRPLSKMAQWKAREWLSWLLFYCIPCLMDLLKVQYLSHLALLSKASYMLLQKSISYADIIEVQRLFTIYSFYMQQNFGVENMQYNVHLLSHVAQGVLNFGPVVHHNSFVFEAQNRYIGQMAESLCYCLSSNKEIFSLQVPTIIVYQVSIMRRNFVILRKYVGLQEAQNVFQTF